MSPNADLMPLLSHPSIRRVSCLARARPRLSWPLEPLEEFAHALLRFVAHGSRCVLHVLAGGSVHQAREGRTHRRRLEHCVQRRQQPGDNEPLKNRDRPTRRAQQQADKGNDAQPVLGGGQRQREHLVALWRLQRLLRARLALRDQSARLLLRRGDVISLGRQRRRLNHQRQVLLQRRHVRKDSNRGVRALAQPCVGGCHPGG
mmetsp:Transcript_449/g.1273  ORF Transcript_449/g.1273 Transcript_449/m.1273 type:complete len:203 (-) Transcript_449:301-909(-)